MNIARNIHKIFALHMVFTSHVIFCAWPYFLRYPKPFYFDNWEQWTAEAWKNCIQLCRIDSFRLGCFVRVLMQKWDNETFSLFIRRFKSKQKVNNNKNRFLSSHKYVTFCAALYYNRSLDTHSHSHNRKTVLKNGKIRKKTTTTTTTIARCT